MAEGQGLKKPPGFKDPNTPPPVRPTGPRKPAVPPTFYKTKKRGNCCRICCCFICFLIVISLILLGIATGIFFIWFQPKIPTFRFRSVDMDRFNITLKPDKTMVLNAQTVIRVEVKNPNAKLSIYYGRTGVSLTANEETRLGTGEVAGFKQPTNNVTVLKFELKVENEEIDETTASKMKEKMKNQEMEVDGVVKSQVGLGLGSLKIGMLPINVRCGGVTLKQINDGNSSPKCSFNTLKWITIH